MLSIKDGYYLSTFLAYDELANSLGIKLRHDQNLSLWKVEGNNFILVKYWELERITGKKQFSNTFNSKNDVVAFINFLLKEEGLVISDINEIWGTLGLQKEINFFHPENISFHSVAHIFSSLFVYGSSLFYKNTIVAIAVDGGPDNLWEKDAFIRDFYAGAVSINGKIEYFSVDSPGFMWSHAKKRLGLREGTLMALSTASSSSFLNQAKPLFLNKDIKNRDQWPAMCDYIDDLIRQAEALTELDNDNLFSGFDIRFTRHENIASMVMKEIQLVSNEIMRRNIDSIIKKYKINPQNSYLALSGGFCLNCTSNSYLMNTFKFKELLAPPCINDSGISFGQALYYFYYLAGGKIKTKPLNPFAGQDFKISNYTLKKYNRYIDVYSSFDKKQFVKDIEENPVIWFNGQAEIGPRALGNRSLISDPRSVEMKNYLNIIKEREWWRPVAPIVLEEKMSLFFYDKKRSPFMLELRNVKPKLASKIPAVCHLDASARIQTLAKKDNPILRKAMISFYNKTGVPIICNTSLNDKNEPIINSPEEAINFALRKKIKIIYFNGKRISLKNHELYNEFNPLNRYQIQNTLVTQNTKNLNPFELSKDQVTVFWDYKYQFGENALLNKDGVIKIKKMTQDIIDRYGYLAR